MKNVICIKWGTLYGAEFVNRLHAMVARNITGPFRFVCFTEDTDGIDPAVDCQPLPPINLPDAHHETGWRKLSVLNANLAGLSGPTLFLDLDIVITESLDPFFEFEPGRFCIIHNWTHPDRKIGNSSVFRFEFGDLAHVLDHFHSQPLEHWMDRYDIEQVFLTVAAGDVAFWPDAWCRSFKKHAMAKLPARFWQTPKLPQDCKILVFHGLPNPNQAISGQWPTKRFRGWYKRSRPAAWLAPLWQV